MEKGFSKQLVEKVKFLGYIEHTEAWARVAWKKNPQLLDFYKTVRLSQVAFNLDKYDKFDNEREAWRQGSTLPFFNGEKFEHRVVTAGSREELKKVLLEVCARS